MVEVHVRGIGYRLVVQQSVYPHHGIFNIGIAPCGAYPPVCSARLNVVHLFWSQCWVSSLVHIAVVVLHEVAQIVVAGAMHLLVHAQLPAPVVFSPRHSQVREQVVIRAARIVLFIAVQVVVSHHILISHSSAHVPVAYREFVLRKSCYAVLLDVCFTRLDVVFYVGKHAVRLCLDQLSAHFQLSAHHGEVEYQFGSIHAVSLLAARVHLAVFKFFAGLCDHVITFVSAVVIRAVQVDAHLSYLSLIVCIQCVLLILGFHDVGSVHYALHHSVSYKILLAPTCNVRVKHGVILVRCTYRVAVVYPVVGSQIF